MVVDRLGGNVNKPLRPVWIYPDSDEVLEWKGEYADEVFRTLYSCDRQSSSPDLSKLAFTPLLLLSASAAIKARHVSEQSWEYIQGAGDDEEHWACFLTPELFWKNKDRILSSHDPRTVEDNVRMVVAEQGMYSPAFEFVVLGTGLTCTAIAGCTSSSPQNGLSSWDGVLALDGIESTDMGENVLVMNEKGVSFSSAVEWFGGLRRLKGIPDPRVLVGFYSTSPNVAMQIILVLVLAFATKARGEGGGKNAFAMIPLGQEPRVVVSKEELRSTVPILQSLLPDGTLWHPSKRALKEVYFFFGGSEVRS